MRILVLSDNHGMGDLLEEITALYEEEIDLWIHCGNSEWDKLDPRLTNFQIVQGDTDLPNEFLVENIKKVDG